MSVINIICLLYAYERFGNNLQFVGCNSNGTSIFGMQRPNFMMKQSVSRAPGIPESGQLGREGPRKMGQGREETLVNDIYAGDNNKRSTIKNGQRNIFRYCCLEEHLNILVQLVTMQLVTIPRLPVRNKTS